MRSEYRHNHYVPVWYQKRFLAPDTHELFYLDLKPDIFTTPQGGRYSSRALKHIGPDHCFAQHDLYTTYLGTDTPRDIEKIFFGAVDSNGRAGVEYFSSFAHPSIGHDTFNPMLLYMSTQKLRTPKGLGLIGSATGVLSRDLILNVMLQLQNLYCAAWTECVWQIADASQSRTKFIISDHPITVYNRECGPRSQWCRGFNDPDVWLHGTHTIFPLSLEKVLILTNLSWARNPYQSAIETRPNPNPFRGAIFKYTEIQTLRHLAEQEVREINFIIKSRALRYIAAAEEEWLYPDKYVSKSDWNTFGHGYLLMPDPRPINLGGTIMWGNNDGTGGAMDEYGRRPWEKDFEKENKNSLETTTLYQFKGEFARLFGPRRRGRTFEVMRLDPEVDSDDFHQYHLSLQRKSYRERKEEAREKKAAH
ncbi:MAG: DUF4238 domain-containing protein [Patescibacteria group bacterium]